jgi:hypothetical protein
MLISFILDTNTWYAKFLPISAPIAFSNTGSPYNPNVILTDGHFDIEKYRAYSPVFLTITQLMTYGAWFALFTAIIVHTFCMSCHRRPFGCWTQRYDLSSMVSLRHCSTIQTQYLGRARYPFALYASVSRSSTLVVCHSRLAPSHHAHRSDQNISHRTPHLGNDSRSPSVQFICHAACYDSGYHSSAYSTECHL